MARITLPEGGIETVFGTYDENLKRLETQFGVRVKTQGHDVIVEGPPDGVSKVETLFSQLGAVPGGLSRLKRRCEDGGTVDRRRSDHRPA
jgi:phosphate starvation-inducible PhoH-like protein